MESPMKRSTEVLIVGAGPVGLMLACLLRRMNVECLVVDRGHGVDPRPRAITLHAPTIELFSDLGLLDSLLGVSIPLERISFHAPGDRVFEGRLDRWDSVVDGYLNSPQPLYQTVLQDEALRLGAAVVYGAKLTGLRQHPGGVQAEMSGAGTEHLVNAAYLVGADGASSAVRRLVGGEMLGDGPVRSYVLMEGDPVQAPPSGETGLYVGGNGMVTLSPLPQGKVRVAGPAREGLRLHRDQQLTAGAVAGMIGDLGFGESLRLASVDRVSHYSVVERIADRFVHGRVFLAGDAAHLNAPAGGQGVNLGFADAAALAWRLASAVDSHDPELFHSYDSERRYAAGHTIGQANVFPIVQAIRGATSQSADQRIQRELDARAGAWTQLHTPTIANEDCSLSVLGRRIGHHALPSRRARKVPVSSAFSIIRRASATLHRTSPCTGTTRLALAAGHLPLPKDLDLAGATQVWVDAWPLPDGAAKHEWPVQAPDALLVGPDRVVRGFLKQTPHSSDAADTAVTTT